MACIYMTLGVCMYSFAIGNLTDILVNLDKNESALRNKINTFNDFAIKANVPDMFRFKAVNFL